jgi:hypothetical protein
MLHAATSQNRILNTDIFPVSLVLRHLLLGDHLLKLQFLIKLLAVDICTTNFAG